MNANSMIQCIKVSGKEQEEEYNFYGVYTYSVGMTLTHKQFTKIWEACKESGKATGVLDDSWCGVELLDCSTYINQGIKVYLLGESEGLYRLWVQVAPCRVLGESVPVKLKKRQYKELAKEVDPLLKKLKIPCSINEMEIWQSDELPSAYIYRNLYLKAKDYQHSLDGNSEPVFISV